MPVLFGAAYYPEYRGFRFLTDDLDLMAEAGFTVIRVGESVWSTWEPSNGQFDLEWLQPVLDGAHERGIAVVLGTPTYAVPPWLARQYPEIAGERGTGKPIPWGARQEADFTHPAFRYHAERVIRAVVGRYATHPAVIGFQVDNEPGLELLHNEGVFQRFADDLRRQYGTVERLNEQWGLVYWSHRLSDWSDLWRPDGNELFYLAPDGSLMSVKVNAQPTFSPAGPPEVLFKIAPEIGYFDVSADGERFLIPVPTGKGVTAPPYKVVLNWTATLK